MPCTISPLEIKRVKAMGFLNNKGTDLFNARIITVNGKITSEQTAVIAEAAKKFGSGEVEFTTRLTVEVRGVHFDSIPDERVIIDPQTVGRDTVALWFNMPAESLPDTIRGSITYFKHDSIRQLQQVTEELKLPWRLIETKAEEREREKLEREKRKAEEAGEEWTPPAEKNPFAYKFSSTGEINPEQDLVIDFDYPLARLDSASLLLTRNLPDSTREEVPVRIVRDTANLRRWHIRAGWTPAEKYTLTIPAGAITDIAGFSNDSITGNYSTMDPEKFATVKINVTAPENGAKYIIQLLDGNGALKQEKRDLTGGLCQFNYVPAGDIRFRIIEDMNGNGKWDAGNLVERRQPERTELYANEKGEDTFATKANWEMEFTMDMSQIFAPVTMESLIRMLDEREEQRLRREAEKLAKEGDKGRREREMQERQADQERFNNTMNTTGGMFMR